jgi:hypothetical protein
MAGEDNNNGGGIANNEFTPSPEFLEQFKNTPIEGADDEGGNNPPPANPPVKTQKELDDEAAAAAAANGDQSEADKIKADEAAAAKLVEDEKISKMNPEEKEAYLKSKDKPADPPPAPVVKSFDEEFAERFGGKKPEEVKAALEGEKEEVFANDQIKFFNELAKKGVTIDANYISAITKNYEGMDNPLEILAEQIRQDNPKMDEDEIEFEIRTRYRMDEWSAEGEEPTEIEKIMAKRQLREAEEARVKLIDNRNSLSFIKPKDPQAEQIAARERLEAQQKFEKTIDTEIVPKVQKLSTEYTDDDGVKHVLDFDIDESAKGRVVPLMKAMGSNAGAFFNQFVGNDKKFNHAKFLEYQYKAENYDSAAKKFFAKGLSIGSEKVVKGIKNVDFENNGKPGGTTATAKSFGEAAAESMNKHF